MGVLLGLMRTHARALPGERAYDFKPFYRGTKISVIGAVTVSQVLAVLKDTASHMMTIDDSMDAAAFKVYVSKCLVPQLWKGAVVVMDNLPAHKVVAIGREAYPKVYTARVLTPCRPLGNPLGLL